MSLLFLGIVRFNKLILTIHAWRLSLCMPVTLKPSRDFLLHLELELLLKVVVLLAVMGLTLFHCSFTLPELCCFGC